MPEKRIQIRGVWFDNVTAAEAAARVTAWLTAPKTPGETYAVYTPNAEIVQLCVEQPAYYDLFNGASLTIPDGIGVIKAARILKTPLKERVPGVELGETMLKTAAERGIRVYFLGGKPGIAEAAARRMTERYPGLAVVGTADGYFDKQGAASDAVVAAVNASGADLLYVCLGVPAQETWIRDNRAAFTTVKVCLALGGSLDVYAGAVKRAPALFRKTGFEWLYRLLREPKRIGRMMKLPRFLLGTYRSRRTARTASVSSNSSNISEK